MSEFEVFVISLGLGIAVMAVFLAVPAWQLRSPHDFRSHFPVRVRVLIASDEVAFEVYKIEILKGASLNE